MMDKVMNHYLDQVDKYLKSMPAGERVDIVKEIKSEMLELEKLQGLSSEQIIERLGNPKELAKAYLGDYISKNTTFSWKKFCSIVGFYSLVGMGSLFILPIISVLSVGLIFSGIISPLSGVIKFIGFLFGFDLPFIMFQIGSFTTPPLLTLLLSVLLGSLFFLAGKGLWKLTIKYIYIISQTKKKIF